MTTDEEYLDNLLKSLTENEQQIKTMEETLNEMTHSTADGESFLSSSKDSGDEQDSYENSNGYSDDDSAYVDEWSSDEQDTLTDGGSEEASSGDDMFADFFAEALSGEEGEVDASGGQFTENEADSEDWQSGLDDLLAKTDEQLSSDAGSADAGNMEVTDLIDNMANANEELEEINGLLKNEGNDSNADDDILALLEGSEVTSVDNSGDNADTVQSDRGSENTDADQSGEDTAENKPAKKGFFSKEKPDKKEKKEKKKKSSRKAENEENPDLGILDEKPSFLMRFLDFLTREEEDGSEGDEVLDKINKENEKKQKKEEKKRKKAEKKKGKSDEALDGEEDEDTSDSGKKKKKKEKKEKKKKEKEETETNEAVKEKPVKILSRKNLLVLIAACATLLGCIFALSTFLTEYSDRQNARQAFYDGDYEEVYRLFYDKNLSSSDSVIYNKVKIVLTIERKLDSYENNLALNRELEAVDALMQGISCYQNLQGVDEYDVRSEVDAVYQQICGILEDKYGITLEKALEINTFDNETYSRALNAIVNGIEFVMPGEEVEEELPPQDILPEEEEIISY